MWRLLGFIYSCSFCRCRWTSGPKRLEIDCSVYIIMACLELLIALKDTEHHQYFFCQWYCFYVVQQVNSTLDFVNKIFSETLARNFWRSSAAATRAPNRNLQVAFTHVQQLCSSSIYSHKFPTSFMWNLHEPIYSIGASVFWL